MRSSRRNFLQLAAAAGAAAVSEQRLRAFSSLAAPPTLLSEFGYRDVELAACLQQTQFEATQAVLMGLNEEARKSLGAQVPHPARLGDASEYGNLAVHIVENPMLNGETIRLDGAIRMAPR